MNMGISLQLRTGFDLQLRLVFQASPGRANHLDIRFAPAADSLRSYRVFEWPNFNPTRNLRTTLGVVNVQISSLWQSIISKAEAAMKGKAVGTWALVGVCSSK
jgi:hypothetical protein